MNHDSTRADALLAYERARLAEKLRARVMTPGYSPSTHAEQIRQLDGLLKPSSASSCAEVAVFTTVTQ